jgi:hypothetical protein
MKEGGARRRPAPPQAFPKAQVAEAVADWAEVDDEIRRMLTVIRPWEGARGQLLPRASSVRIETRRAGR